MGSSVHALAAKPGDDLLFHRLSDSIIGAVRFHGRVRDGIGWVTDAMATKLWGQRMFGFFDAKTEATAQWSDPNRCIASVWDNRTTHHGWWIGPLTKADAFVRYDPL